MRCEEGEYRDFKDKVCYPCDDAISGCVSCDYNVEDDEV